ncbi:MAG: hypothetical protein FRX49_06982 [Trebouxia sp. A1-2]|nr:MAG: hypothetical protein FRX49_06982 [Trebouxia sp. A1-2]
MKEQREDAKGPPLQNFAGSSNRQKDEVTGMEQRQRVKGQKKKKQGKKPRHENAPLCKNLLQTAREKKSTSIEQEGEK